MKSASAMKAEIDAKFEEFWENNKDLVRCRKVEAKYFFNQGIVETILARQNRQSDEALFESRIQKYYDDPVN